MNVDERRRRARQAAYDAEPEEASMYYDRGSIYNAVRVATEVKITPEVIEAIRDVWPTVTDDGAAVVARAAFRAAGFDVS